jgi:hypothetical protein
LKGGWDLVVIEGWFDHIKAFIHEIRTMRLPDFYQHSGKQPIVLYYYLDSTISEERRDAILKLDLDGFLTNSRHMETSLAKIAPTTFLPLAVDRSMRRQPASAKYAHRVVYVGQWCPGRKSILKSFLRACVPFGLVIYGSGWGASPEFKPFWKGVLPLNDLPVVYSSSNVVLGATDDVQKSLGMINNRVFEALACGAILISDYFPALEEHFGNKILYAHSASDVSRFLSRLFGVPSTPPDAEQYGTMPFDPTVDSYDNRVSSLLHFYDQLRAAPRRATGNAQHAQHSALSTRAASSCTNT